MPIVYNQLIPGNVGLGDGLPEAQRFDRGVRDPWCAGAIRRARVGSASIRHQPAVVRSASCRTGFRERFPKKVSR
jgi:hypothetical protein